MRRLVLSSAPFMFVVLGGLLGLTMLPSGAAASTSQPTVSASTWTAAAVPSPNTTGSVRLAGISCTSSSFCVAVGPGPVSPVVEQWNGQEWSLASLPSSGTGSGFNGVSCVASSFCMAVGVAGPPGGGVLMEEWNGSDWSVTPSPPLGGTAYSLESVSCASSTWCVAVGWYEASVLVEQWNGTGWTLANASPPAGYNTYQLNSVDCLSSSYCVAVGGGNVNQANVTFIETWNGNTWSIVTSPNPSSPSPTAQSNNDLYSVSCASFTFCAATGTYYTSSLGAEPLIETWNGSSWTVTPNPNASPTMPVSLTGVDCFSATTCTAVGQAADEDTPENVSRTLAETWNGSAWSLVSTPNQGTMGSVFDAVSCVTDWECVAAGDFTIGEEVFQPFLASAPIARTGYRFVASDGGVFNYGSGAPFLGSLGGTHLNQPIVGMAAMPGGDGYYLVAADGGVFAFGSAQFYGSTGSIVLNKPIVGMAVTPDGGGYWLVASDGGIFSFGDAQFYGSTGNIVLNKPIVGMAVTPDGGGYWLVASDGGIFSFGDAQFYGSTGNIRLNKPIVGMASTPDGKGYYLVASDGGVFTEGDAVFDGSSGNIHLNKPIVGMSVPSSGGYYLVASDGGIFSYPATGGPPFLGSTGSIVLNRPIVGLSS